MKRTVLFLIAFLLLLSSIPACAETFTIPELKTNINIPKEWGIITRETKKENLLEDLHFLFDELENRSTTIGFIYYMNSEQMDALIAQLVFDDKYKINNQTGISKSDYKEGSNSFIEGFKKNQKFDGEFEDSFVEGKDVNFIKFKGKLNGDKTVIYVTIINGVPLSAIVQYLNENTLLTFEQFFTNLDVDDYDKGVDNASAKPSFFDFIKHYVSRELSLQVVSALVLLVAGVIYGIISIVKKNKKKKKISDENKQNNSELPKKKQKMPWYYWFIGVVVYVIIEMAIDKSAFIQAFISKSDNLTNSVLTISMIYTVIHFILAFFIPSFLWKLRLKAKHKNEIQQE